MELRDGVDVPVERKESVSKFLEEGGLKDSFLIKRNYSIVDFPGFDTELKEGEAPALILYRYRWLVLFSFFLSSASIGAV